MIRMIERAITHYCGHLVSLLSLQRLYLQRLYLTGSSNDG